MYLAGESLANITHIGTLKQISRERNKDLKVKSP